MQTALNNAQAGVTSAQTALDGEKAKLARFQQAEQRTNDRLKALNKAASDAAAARTAADDNKRSTSILQSQLTGEKNEQTSDKNSRKDAQKASKTLIENETKAKKSLDQTDKDLKSLTDAHQDEEVAKASLDWTVQSVAQNYNAEITDPSDPNAYDSALQAVRSAYDSSRSARQKATKEQGNLAKNSKDAENNYKAIEDNRQNEATKLGQLARDSKAAEANYKAIEDKRAKAAAAQGDLAKASKDAENKFAAAEANRKAIEADLAKFQIHENCVVPSGKVVVEANAKKNNKGGLAETGADSIAAVAAAVVLLSAGTGLALSRKHE